MWNRTVCVVSRGTLVLTVALAGVGCASAGGQGSASRAAPAAFATNSGAGGSSGASGRAAPSVQIPDVEIDLTTFSRPLSERKTLVVLDFDYSAVSSSISVDDQESLGSLIRALRGQPDDQARSENNLGAGVAELIVNQILETGQFRILERRQLAALEREQALMVGAAAPGATTPLESARLMGARYALVGSVTRLGSEETNQGLGLGSRALGLGAVGRRSRNTVVGLTGRVVDTETGEVLLAVTAEGSSDRGGGFSLGGGSRGGGLALGSSTSNVRETAIGEATDQAILALVQQVAERWDRLR